MRIPESELVLNSDGSIYHLNLHPEQVGEIILLVGDQGRVARISKYFDRVDVKVQKREFLTHGGELAGKRITVISTGIGSDNIDIVINELDALVNVDLKTREVKKNLTSLQLIRVGTSGSLQEDIPVDSMVVSTFGLGLDNLLSFYDYTPEPEVQKLHSAIGQFLQTRSNRPLPSYLVKANSSLIRMLEKGFFKGITATCSGFYGPQGRSLRAKAAFGNLPKDLGAFQSGNYRITNFEMETAAIYGMAKLLGHRAASCNVILANRITGDFSKNPAVGVDKLIQAVLGKVSA